MKSLGNQTRKNLGQDKLVVLGKSKKNYNQPQGMAGFFSWLSRAVENVANAVVSVSISPFFILSIVKDAFDGNGFNLGNQKYMRLSESDLDQDVVLTPEDEAALDYWVDNYWLPYFLPFFSKLKEFSIVGQTTDQFIAYYNDVQKLISLINWYQVYVMTVGENNFTIEALEARNKFLAVQIVLIEAELNEYLKLESLGIRPQMWTLYLQSENYISTGFNLPATIRTEGLQLIISDNRDSPVFEKEYGTTENTNDKSNVSSGVKVLAWAVVGYGIFRILNNSSDQEKE